MSIYGPTHTPTDAERMTEVALTSAMADRLSVLIEDVEGYEIDRFAIARDLLRYTFKVARERGLIAIPTGHVDPARTSHAMATHGVATHAMATGR